MSLELKIVLMGAGGVGKSAITVQFLQGTFLKKYDPTIEESFRKPYNHDGVDYMLEILDTAGTDQFTEMRDLYVKNGQGFVLVFSLVVKETLSFLEGVREQIVKIKDTEDVPLCLAGNKADLAERRKVSTEEGQRIAEQSYKGRYFETSAKDGQNIPQLFRDIVDQVASRLTLDVPAVRKKPSGCVLF
eukprot:TRINITY_DN1704_c0_g1_i10.p1 TRINITY_DN1704_c0_g1~~TRINITY_DN1704_c0_g1_i10.p1  ORF type:complete len:188 (-),score=44.94 TRINITY_DN1704_c0_g1_i10:125-688(-)